MRRLNSSPNIKTTSTQLITIRPTSIQTETQTENDPVYNQYESYRKEVILMPTLKHLLEELKKLAVDPDEVRMPGTLYDELVEQAEEANEKEEE
ncbi:hypothetical protein ES703_06450 [subsurface metagenome]